RLRSSGRPVPTIADALATDAELELRADGASPVVPLAKPTEGVLNIGRTGQRRILRDDRGVYVGVHESGGVLASTEDLVAAERRTRGLTRGRLTRSARPKNGGGEP